jgi:hypothetical protein
LAVGRISAPRRGFEPIVGCGEDIGPETGL